ncbi:MAG: NAD(P)-dependent malic enzyme [Candidatus Hodarchaeales archaeon]
MSEASFDAGHEKKDALVKYNDQDVIDYHSNNFPGNGKIYVGSKTSLETTLDLTLAYSPGVAVACKVIEKEEAKVYDQCAVGNTVGVVSNCTRVLGLGDIGPRAGLPVMEGKAILFKGFGFVDTFPIVLNEKDPDKVIEHCVAIAKSFGGINLEDIRKPDCFKIEEEVQKRVDIPVWHDDQWGTALVTTAGVINALKVAGKKIQDSRVTMTGSGASGIAISKMLMMAGVQGKNLILTDRNGAVFNGRGKGMDFAKDQIAKDTNPDHLEGDLAKIVKEFTPDVMIGASNPKMFTPEMIKDMNGPPVVFAIANPVPEIWPEDAFDAGAIICGTGRSDYKYQINNVLGFPGVFRGALDVRAKTVNREMKVAAAYSLANSVPEDKLNADMIIPSPLDHKVYMEEAVAVAEAAMSSGVARINRTADWIRENFEKLRKFYMDNENPIIEKRKNY